MDKVGIKQALGMLAQTNQAFQQLITHYKGEENIPPQVLCNFNHGKQFILDLIKSKNISEEELQEFMKVEQEQIDKKELNKKLTGYIKIQNKRIARIALEDIDKFWINLHPDPRNIGSWEYIGSQSELNKYIERIQQENQITVDVVKVNSFGIEIKE